MYSKKNTNTLKLHWIICILICLPTKGFTQSFQVGEQTLLYQDGTRDRPVKVEIWYPTADEDPQEEKRTDLPFQLPATIRGAEVLERTFPLVVLSHGTGGNRFSLAWLAIELVKNGYIVIAPDHYGNTFNNKIPEFFVRYWERPLDIKFLLDNFLAEPDFGDRIEQNRMAMVGFSLGGYTTLATAGVEISCARVKDEASSKNGKKQFKVPELGDLRKYIEALDCNEAPKNMSDDRLKAFVAMAPALGLGLPKEIQKVDQPVLIIGCEGDDIAPVASNAQHYHQQIPGSDLLQLGGEVGHYVFLNRGDSELQKVAKRFYTDDKSVDRGEVHQQVGASILRFLDQHLGR